MVAIEIPPNNNCTPVDLRLFHDVELPRPVAQVYLEREPGYPDWYDVVGWTPDNRPCEARAQRVDDSGDGLAVLVSGGEAGLRLRPAGSHRPWSLEDPAQFGESFLLLGDVEGVRIIDGISSGTDPVRG